MTIRILNASTNAVIVEKTTATPTSSSYISTNSPLSLGDVAVAFKIQMYGPAGKGVRLRNYSVTGTPAGDIPTTYTVTYDANGGSGTMTDSDSPYTAGATVTVLGNEFTRTDYEFDHWNTAADDSGTSYDEDDTFTINANTTLYAQWTENTTPTPGGITAILNIAAYAEANSWINSTQYTTATVAPVTFTANGGGNTGKYYTSGQDWRFYQNESASITITVPEGYTLVSVTPTYSVSSGGVLKNGNSTITSGSTFTVSGTSVTFTVGNSGTATNGQVRFTNIEVVYVSDGSTQTASDLAITNATTDLAFDLYNNTTAQVINYTTSSTGAITITPAESSYFTYVHDATAKTITVTPTAVTPSAQTVTISQEADEDYYAGTASFTVSVANSDPNLPGTVNNPYTVAEAIAATPSSGNVYIQGIVSSFYNTSIVGDGTNYRYYISDDGTTTTQLLVYKGKGLNQATFTDASDLLVGDEVVICGTLTMYQNAPEINSGNYLYSWNRPSTPAQEYTLTVTASDNVEIFTFIETTTEAVEGSTIQQVYNGTEVGISVSATTGYILTLMVDGEDVTSELDDTGYYTFTMPAHNVTVSATASVAPVVTTNTYTLATSIESGKQYIIVGWADGTPYAMGYNKGNNRHAVEISVDEEEAKATATIDNTETNPHEFTITSLGNGYYSIMDATTSGGYLYAAGSSNNYLKTEDALDENHNGDWKITITEGSFSVIADQSDNRNVMQFNNGSTLFNCYASASQHPVYLYVKDETPATETYPLTVDAYTDDNTKDGYNLIASPVNVDPANVIGMTTGDFDLYYFDESQEDEWRNYEATSFNLVPGKGYLYAKKATTENQTYSFELTGTPYNNQPITLSKSESGDFPGWNLVGNPLGETAVLSDSRDFYVMNSEGSDFIQSSGDIAPMQGIFVIAGQNGEELVFTAAGGTSTGPTENSKLVLNLTKGRGIIDRAVVRFGEGRTLPKFMLNADNTKLYITEGNQDFAVVRSNNEGEMPVSFKAAENGNYTLSIETENVEVSYLHLIDNMTGANVDLLATPSYSFDARTTDNANRFRLMFNTNGVDENTTTASFAYFNGSSWTISDMGEATLQVVDMMGRVISTQAISGNTDVNLNQAAGVYMLRLVNGENVMVQKVVVR